MQNDPLDRAVEELWLNGVVVVTAAGNYAIDGAESGVGFAPANDPFVITVGASDTNGTRVRRRDDFAAPWSAWGSTQDGFRKPELAAPGPRAQRAGCRWTRPMFTEQPVAKGRRRVHVDVGNVVRGPDRRGRSRNAALAASGLDTRSGQGRADGLGERARPDTTRSDALGVGT